MSSQSEILSLTPLLRAKKAIAIYPPVIILSLFIAALIYTAYYYDLHYMDYINVIYISLLFIIIILGSFSKKLVISPIRNNFRFLFLNKGKGIIFLMISLSYLGYSPNYFLGAINIFLLIIGILLISLDYLIKGEYEVDDYVDETLAATVDKRHVELRRSNPINEGNIQLDKSAENNPYSIPQDF